MESKRKINLWKFECVDTEPTPPPLWRGVWRLMPYYRKRKRKSFVTCAIDSGLLFLSYGLSYCCCVTAEEWQSFPSHWLRLKSRKSMEERSIAIIILLNQPSVGKTFLRLLTIREDLQRAHPPPTRCSQRPIEHNLFKAWRTLLFLNFFFFWPLGRFVFIMESKCLLGERIFFFPWLKRDGEGGGIRKK